MRCTKAPVIRPPGVREVTLSTSATMEARAGASAPVGPDLVVLAAAHILTILLDAAGQPLATGEILRQVDPECQPAARQALGQLAGEGAVEQAGSPDGQGPRWQLARPPGGW